MPAIPAPQITTSAFETLMVIPNKTPVSAPGISNQARPCSGGTIAKRRRPVNAEMVLPAPPLPWWSGHVPAE